MINKKFELSVYSDSLLYGHLEILKQVLLKAGIPEEEIVEYKDKRRGYLSSYFSTHKKAQGVQESLRSFKIKGFKVRIKKLLETDWQNAWKKKFKPFHFTKKFSVVPMWLKKSFKQRGRTPIYIDSHLSFGTGEHETTRFMANIIEDSSGKFQTFLDLGCGTGILSLLALKLGAQRVTAVDINPDCIRNTRFNLKENGLKEQECILADIQKLHLKGEFDFVAANLVTNDLLEFSQKIVGWVSPGKYLAISGVSLENYSLIRKEFKRFPLKCLRILRGKEWTAILYQKEA
jgi:ribosomal protein L11 methyltransferase